MESFFEQNKVIAAIEQWTVTDDEFKSFCNALEIKPIDFLSLKSNSNRTYSAIRKWLQTSRTRQDFAFVLLRWQNMSLAAKLGFDIDLDQIRNGQIVSSEKKIDNQPSATWLTQHSSSLSSSANPFAAALNQKSQVFNVKKFIEANDHWLARICVAANDSASWEALLGHLGLLTSPGIEKIVREYHQLWQNRTNNPMLDVLTQLCESDNFASQSVDELSALLKKLENPQLTRVLHEWDEFRGSKMAIESSKNIQAFDGARELKDWLIKTGVSDNEDVETDVALLRSAKYGVKTLAHLLKLRPGSFADMSLVKAQTLEDAIAAARSVQ